MILYMPCPNCGENLNTRLVDNQAILYCLNCGGCFFEENGINRISLRSAEKLASEVKNILNKQSAYPKNLCPKDNSPLAAINNEDTVPTNLNLLRCPQCHGIFTLPHDLVAFKKAQKAKVNYFKLWNIPTPSISALLVFNFILVMTIAIISGALLNQRSIGTIQQAKDLITSVTASKSGRYLFVYFKTSQPLRSDIIFFDATLNTTVRKNVSEKPAVTHQLTTGDIALEDIIYYQIVLIDKNGRETMIERVRLTLN